MCHFFRVLHLWEPLKTSFTAAFLQLVSSAALSNLEIHTVNALSLRENATVLRLAADTSHIRKSARAPVFREPLIL